MEKVEATSEGLLQKAINFLFKGLDKIIEESISERKDSKVKLDGQKAIEKEGKMGKSYKFVLTDEKADGGVYIDVWPIKGKKDLYYVDRVAPFGTNSFGKKMEVNETKPRVWKRKDFARNILDIIGQEVDEAGESDKKAKESAKEWELSKEAAEAENPLAEFEEADNGVTNASEAVLNSATKFKVKLKKVVASNTFDLVAVDYDDNDAEKIWDAICDIAESPEFAATVETEEPVCLEVEDSGTGDLEVTPIEEFEADSTDVTKYLYELVVNAYNKLMALDYACRDGQFQAFCEPVTWILREMIGVLTHLRIKYENVYPNPGTVTCTGGNLTSSVKGIEGIKDLYEIANDVSQMVSLKVYSLPETDRPALLAVGQRLEDRINCDLLPYIRAEE